MPNDIPSFSEFQPDLNIPTPSGFQGSMAKFLAVLKERGVTATLVSGERSQQQQQSIWNRRDPKTGLFHGNPVAPPGTSMHQMNLARDYKFSGPMSIDQIGALARQHGLRWGGDFKRRDPGHFQAAEGQSPVPGLSQSEETPSEIPSFGEFEKTIPSLSEFDKETPQSNKGRVYQATKVEDIPNYVPKASRIVPKTGDVANARGILTAALKERKAAEQTLAAQIRNHFGYSVLVEFPNLPKAKQQQIVKLAQEYSTQPRSTNSGTESTIANWATPEAIATRKARYDNQATIGLREGSDIPVHQPADIDAALTRKWRDAANPFIYWKGKAGAIGEGRVAKGVHRALVKAGAGMTEAAAGAIDLAVGPVWGHPEKASAASGITDPMYRAASSATQDLSEAVESDPLGRSFSLGPLGEISPADEAVDIGGSILQYAPLMAIAPEYAAGNALRHIGLLALKGGIYSALQAKGRRESAENILKEGAVGAGTFAAMGLPLAGGAVVNPIKRFLAKATSGLVITGGAVTGIQYASGQPLDKAARAGLMMTLLRFPEMRAGVQVKAPSGEVRQATPADIQKLWMEQAGRKRLGPARFETETARPVTTSPQTVLLPARQAGTVAEPGAAQGELFTAIRPGEEAGRSDLPGFHPEAQTFEQFAQARGLDLNSTLAQNLYQEYRDKTTSTAGRPANAPPRYAQWAKEAEEAEAEWNKRQGSTQASPNVQQNVADAIAEMRANGPTAEARAFFAGIEPRLVGTTIAKVAAFAKKLGVKWEPEARWVTGEETTASSPGASASGPSAGLLGEAPDGTRTQGARTQTAVGGPAQPMQMMFTMAGPGGERVPVFDSRAESTNAALVRLQRLRLDPEIWDNLSPQDRAAIGRSIAQLKSGKTPAVILDEALLSQQGPGVMRMGEDTARANLIRMKEEFKRLQQKGVKKTAAEKKGMGELKRAIDALEKQGAGELPVKPAAASPDVQSRVDEVLKDARAKRTGQEGFLNLSEIEAAIRVLKEKLPKLEDAELRALVDHSEKRMAEMNDRAHPLDTENWNQSVRWRAFPLPPSEVKAAEAVAETGEPRAKAERPTMSTKAELPSASSIKLPEVPGRSVRVVKKGDIGKATPADTFPSPRIAPEEASRTNAQAKASEYQEWKRMSPEAIRARLSLSQHADVEVARGTKLRRIAGEYAGMVGKTLNEAGEALEGMRDRKGEAGYINASELREGMKALREKFPQLSDVELRAMLQESDRRLTQPTTPTATAASPFAGQEGGATTTAISGGIAEKIAKTRNTIRLLNQTRPVRQIMAVTNGAGANEAFVFGKQQRTAVAELLRETTGVRSRAGEASRAIGRTVPVTKTSAVARDALAFTVEAQGDPSQLDVMRNKITTSTEAKPGWVKRSTEAIDYAKANFARLAPATQKFAEIHKAQLDAERAAGVATLEYPGYVMHLWDVADLEPNWLERGGRGSGANFEKMRTYPTFADGIAKGLNPKSLDALDLLQSRITKGQRLINEREWVTNLRATNDPTTGAPVAVDPDFQVRADGKRDPVAPKGYHIEFQGRQPIAIQNGYEGLYAALTDPSFFSKNAGLRNFQRVNAFGKSVALAIDSFHLGRIMIKQGYRNAVNLKSPLPSFRKGLTMLDATPEEIQRMIDRGDVPKAWESELKNVARENELMLSTNYNIGGVADNMHQEWIRKIPGIGDFNRFLFDQYQRGAMREVWSMEYRRISRARPEWSDMQRARKVSADLNKTFGNLGTDSVFKSRTALDVGRALVLAPQWNEGLIRSELGAVRQAGELVRDAAQGKRLYTPILLQNVGMLSLATLIANQILNYATRGHSTFQNPEEGFGAKISAWIPDIGGGPGFFLHPMGLAAETTHLLMQGFERTGNFGKTMDAYLRSRASWAARPVITYATSTDYLGRQLRPGTVAEGVTGLVPWPLGPGGQGSNTGEAANQLLPAPIPWEPAKAALRNKETFPGQFQKQLMSSVGIRTESAPSGEQRIRRLASEFNEKHGVKRQGEFYTSDYQETTAAPTTANVKKLIETKMENDFVSEVEARKQVEQYFSNRATHPLTGSKEKEEAFVKTLNPEQRAQYDAIYQKRKAEKYQVKRLLMGLPLQVMQRAAQQSASPAAP